MQATLETINRDQLIEQTKADFNRNKERLYKDFETTPDDKIGWSPSPSCRTPLEIIAHIGLAIGGFHGMMMGGDFPWDNIPEADRAWRKMEKEYKSRQDVLNLIEENSAKYLAWMDTLTDDQLAGTFRTPFGEVPISVAITFMGNHMSGHSSQIQYIQTIYGDMDWHMA